MTLLRWLVMAGLVTLVCWALKPVESHDPGYQRLGPWRAAL